LILPMSIVDSCLCVPLHGEGTFFMPNVVGGATLYSQFHALDPSQPGIAVRNSNGMSFTVPNPNLTQIVRVTRLYSFSGPTAQFGSFDFFGVVGYGIVTQLTYQ
jgi:hypothetical protein